MTDKGLFLFPKCHLNNSRTKTLLWTVLLFKLSFCQKKSLHDGLGIKAYCKAESWGLETFPVDWELRVCSPSGSSGSLFKTTALCSPGSGLKTLLQTTFFPAVYLFPGYFQRSFACLQCFEKENDCYCSPTALLLPSLHSQFTACPHVICTHGKTERLFARKKLGKFCSIS